MKKSLKIIVLVATICLVATSAWAIPMDTSQWIDEVTINEKIDTWETYTITHKLDGYNAGQDVVDSYFITLELVDDKKDPWYNKWEIAFINQPGKEGDELVFANQSVFLGSTLAGLSLIQDGVFSYSIASVWGDFKIGSSTLTAEGQGVAPVPEPATLLLLGTGILGMVGIGRKARKSA